MTLLNATLIAWALLSTGLTVVYFRGWRKLSMRSRAELPLWRSLSFPLGLFLIWLASSSPFAMLDEEYLTAHMVQHLLLMTFAPYLILACRPKTVLLNGLPAGFLRSEPQSAFNNRFVNYIERLWGQLVLCWTISIGVLIVWHVPIIFRAAIRSESWHVIEHFSFLAAGFLFWSPLFPLRSGQRPPAWSLVLYFFLATLPCDILSGFLVFSDRVVYSSYLTRHHPNWSALDDQQCAAALMWTVVTIAYLLPAASLTIRLLGVRQAGAGEMAGSK